jgi:rhodanese-related sulfurtransferase
VEPHAEIPPSELKRRLDAGEPTAILDVREPWEHELCAIPGARLIPMDQLVARVGELDPGREIIVHCHHGQRSAAVVSGSARHPGSEPARRHRRVGGRVDPTLRRYYTPAWRLRVACENRVARLTPTAALNVLTPDLIDGLGPPSGSRDPEVRVVVLGSDARSPRASTWGRCGPRCGRGAASSTAPDTIS